MKNTNRSSLISSLKISRNLRINYGLIFIFYLWQYAYNWPGLRLDRLIGNSKFIDLSGIISAIPCFQTLGNDIYKTNNAGGLCSGFIYSTDLLRILAFLQIDTTDVVWLGFVFGGAFILMLLHEIYLINPIHNRLNFLILAAVLSPGIWLLLERGNFDIPIIILIYLSALTLRTKVEWLSVALISLSAVMKYYTLPLLILIVLISKNKFTKLLSILSLIFLIPHLFGLYKKVNAFPSTWFVSFGIDALPLYFNRFLQLFNLETHTLSYSEIKIVGIAITVIYYSCFRKSIGIFSESVVNNLLSRFDTRIVQIHLFSTSAFLTCYFGGINYDYRLAFLVISLISSLIFENVKYFLQFRSLVIISLIFSTFTFGLF